MSPALEIPETLRAADLALQSLGIHTREVAWTLLNDISNDETSLETVLALKKKAGCESDEVERLLVWHAAQQSLPRLASLPVDKPVRERLDKDLRKLHAMSVSMAAGSYHFNRAAKIASLRRFPAGPMEWEISGIPRSFLLEAAFPANLRLLTFILFRVGGWGPCFFMHVAPAPDNRALSVPKLVLRAYYRMARSMQLQPAVRALVAHAWFHDPAALRDHPHLDALNQPYTRHGGWIAELGPAPPSSGVLEGSAQRRADYLAGKVQYNYGFAVWPRDAAVRWADAHPEFAD